MLNFFLSRPRIFILFCLSIFIFNYIFSSEKFFFTLTKTQAELIGQRIWDNECRGKSDLLTWWNEGEEFASMGIHHFIWYPKDKKGVYEETFPSLIRYLQKQSVVVPGWLSEHPPCPWNTRKEFMDDFESRKMVELRRFLLKTRPFQVKFMVERLSSALNKIVRTNQHLHEQYQRVLSTKKGAYILLDYYTFKGDGTSETEKYEGFGWGLFQVLEEMKDIEGSADFAFVRAARKVLERRVVNAPKDRNEAKWLNGWLNRLKTYE